MALTAVAHERRALLSELSVGRGAPHDRFRFGAHLRKQAIRRGGIEAAQAHEPAAHDLVGNGRAQQPDRGADARIGGNEHAGDPELLGDPRSMQRRGAAECDQRARAQVLPALDGMHAGRVRHVLVHHLADAERRMLGCKLSAAPIRSEMARAARGDIERHRAAGEGCRIDAAEHEVGIGHGGLGPPRP